MREVIVAMMVREVIVTMMVMREVMQPVEDELADDKLSASAGEINRVIREGCPFLWGWKGYSSGGRWDLCWEEDVSAGEEGNLRLENRCPPCLRWKGIWEGQLGSPRPKGGMNPQHPFRE